MIALVVPSVCRLLIDRSGGMTSLAPVSMAAGVGHYGRGWPLISRRDDMARAAARAVDVAEQHEKCRQAPNRLAPREHHSSHAIVDATKASMIISIRKSGKCGDAAEDGRPFERRWRQCSFGIRGKVLWTVMTRSTPSVLSPLSMTAVSPKSSGWWVPAGAGSLGPPLITSSAEPSTA